MRETMADKKVQTFTLLHKSNALSEEPVTNDFNTQWEEELEILGQMVNSCKSLHTSFDLARNEAQEEVILIKIDEFYEEAIREDPDILKEYDEEHFKNLLNSIVQ